MPPGSRFHMCASARWPLRKTSAAKISPPKMSCKTSDVTSHCPREGLPGVHPSSSSAVSKPQLALMAPSISASVCTGRGYRPQGTFPNAGPPKGESQLRLVESAVAPYEDCLEGQPRILRVELTDLHREASRRSPSACQELAIRSAR